MSIEITEGTLLSNRPEVATALFSIHEAGMEVTIDDFGTGYSSLSYLQEFKIDFLKIDKSFTRGLKPDSTELALSEAIIVMAHKLGIRVIAEGIETAEQRDLLVEAGCDFGQGYLFSRPVPREEFEVFLQSRFDSDGHSANGSGIGKRV
jgi:EAL domain-containing protein (putative c-di-GMP-specific phosphodiesterase class I)